MKKIILLVVALMATVVMSGCGGLKLTPAQQSVVDNQASMFTQVSIWVDKNRVYGTNFARGLHIPINTKVKILKMNAKVIVFEYQGSKINYYVTTKHTKIDAGKTLDRIFGKKAVDLSKYSKSTQKNIKAGKVAIGMSKEEVVLSRGYPPFHQTLSLKANKWKYWNHRFKTANVIFENNKVVSKTSGIM
jgi:uncharacterized protein YceK